MKKKTRLSPAFCLLASFIFLTSAPALLAEDFAIVVDYPPQNSINQSLYTSGRVLGPFNYSLFVIGSIQRDSDGRYWDGTNWVTTRRALWAKPTYPSTYNGVPVPTYQSWGFPEVNYASFQDGGYTLKAEANNGATVVQTSWHLFLDRTSPGIYIASVQPDAVTNAFPGLSGTFVDPLISLGAQSGVQQVVAQIHRLKDNLYWDGTAWNGYGLVEAAINSANRTWSLANLPVLQQDGGYEVTAIALDGVGNQSDPYSVMFTLDRTPPPPAAVTTPPNGATVTGLTEISGTVSDTYFGSGIESLRLSLQRDDGFYWNGSAWSSFETFQNAALTYVPVPLGFNPALHWSVSSNLPSGANLRNGSYKVRTEASDLAHNKGYSTNSFTVNLASPTMKIIWPTDGGAAPGFQIFYGEFTVAAGQVVDRVDLYLMQNTTGKFWDGTNWTSLVKALPPLISSTNWYYFGPFPQGTNAPEQDYFLLGYVYDKSGQSALASSNFKVDTLRPTLLTIATPANGQVLSNFTLLQGKVMDNTNGSGIDRVTMTLRKADGTFWTGSNWGNLFTSDPLQAVLSGSEWALAGNLPSQNQTPEGIYTLTVHAVDKAGNYYSPEVTITNVVDRTPPEVAIQSLTSGQTILGLSSLKGTARDTNGIAAVRYALHRLEDQRWWDGTNWVSSLAWCRTTVAGLNWWANDLPFAGNMPDGYYELRAQAVDQSGLAAMVTIPFAVRKFPTRCAGLASSYTNATTLAIPDQGSLQSSFTISGAGNWLWDLNVRTHIQHTFNHDLIISLTSPAGTTVVLSSKNGGSADNVFDGTLWDDQAGTTVVDAFYENMVPQPSLIPESALGAFIGENPNGTWRLTIQDADAQDTGLLKDWSLDLLTLPAAPFKRTVSFTNLVSTPIPDGGNATNLLTVSGLGTSLQELKVRTSIQHPAPGDLNIFLLSPQGTITPLSTGNGAFADGVFNGTQWSDKANNPVTDALFSSGSLLPALTPEGAMAAFNGEDPNGVWSLLLRDSLPPNSGTLNQWSMEVTTCDCLVPRLRIARAGASAIVKWSSDFSSHRLEKASSIQGPWTSVTEPKLLGDLEYYVTLPATDQARFFRLVFP